jgi:glycosyltransferase involved in cell wall biosynthesis
MRICYIVDARSSISRNWVSHFISSGHEVHVVSSYPFDPKNFSPPSAEVVPLAFSGFLGGGGEKKAASGAAPPGKKPMRRGLAWTVLDYFRNALGPLDVMRQAGRVRRIVEEFKPDLVHALRIPFEGLVAAEALAGTNFPLLISVWGNDFTYFAQRHLLIGSMTKRVMARAGALLADCPRDLRLAGEWGFSGDKPSQVLPGAGGVPTDIFRPGEVSERILRELSIPENAPVVFNPRGYKPNKHLRNDIFFKSIPRILAKVPGAIFIVTGLGEYPVAMKSLKEAGADHAIRALPMIPWGEMVNYYRMADVIVSPGVHDGTPNSLLEGMACGAFPVVGDIESVRDWVEDGVNGILCDPSSVDSQTEATLRALGDADLRARAAKHNFRLIQESAERSDVMGRAEDFYQRVLLG